MADVTTQATVSVQALLVAANSLLTLLAGYFIRQFVGDVRKLTEQVVHMDKKLAILEVVVDRHHKQPNHNMENDN